MEVVYPRRLTSTLDLNNGAADLAIDFNFGTVGQADGLVQFASAYNPTFIDTDGAAFGQFSGVTINTAGLVTALFENGDIRPIFRYQWPLSPTLMDWE